MERLQTLLAEQRITGVFDERGKFIYISEEEKQRIKELIKAKGRISIEDLTIECNRIVKLDNPKQHKSDE